jgi:hypothetical protein
MTPAEAFSEVANGLATIEDGVELGRMMSSPGVTYRGKVFCFFYDSAMVFKLGKDAETSSPDLHGWQWLNPFKNKAPLKAWYVVPLQDTAQWDRLARAALTAMKAGD